MARRALRSIATVALSAIVVVGVAWGALAVWLEGPVAAQNSISCEIRGFLEVRSDETHELSRTPTIPDGAGQSEQVASAMEIERAMALPARQRRRLEIAQPSRADQAARRS